MAGDCPGGFPWGACPGWPVKGGMLSSDDSWFKGIVDTDLSNGHFDNSISTSQSLIEFDRGNNPLDWDAEVQYVPRISATALSEKMTMTKPI